MPIGSGDHNQEKKITFSAQDGNLSSFMKKLMNDQKGLYDAMAKEAKKQTDNEKEQVKLIEQKIRLLERQSRLERELARDKIANLRKFGGEKEQDLAAEMADRLRASTIADRLRVGGLRENLINDKGRIDRSEQEKPEKKESIFNSVMLASLFRDLTGLLRQGAHAKTGLDLVSPAASMLGGISGGLVGAGLDAANINILGTGLGKTNMGVIMGQMGKELGGLAGDLVVRHLQTKDAFDASRNQLQAFNGMGDRFRNMSGSGFDDIETYQAGLRLARARGGSGGGAELMLNLQRGFSVDEGAILGSAGLQRMGTGGLTNMQRGLGIAIAEGLNRSRFTDVIQNQTALLQEFSKTANSADQNQANRVLFEMNRLGGPFAIGDPRALGNINAIQAGLTDPGSDFGQAQNYAILRRLNPNAGAWQLRKMQEQGLQTPGFLGAVMQEIMGSGLSEDSQKFMLQGRFKGLSKDAIDTLFKMGPGAIGSMRPEEFNKFLGSKVIAGEAQSLTTTLQRDTAEVTNAFKNGMLEGVNAVATQFKERFSEAIQVVAEELKRQLGIKDGAIASTSESINNIFNPSMAAAAMGQSIAGRPSVKRGSILPLERMIK